MRFTEAAVECLVEGALPNLVSLDLSQHEDTMH